MTMPVWEPEAVAFLVEHIDKKSTGQIARELGDKSRNAVCGMVWRLQGKGVLPPPGTRKHYSVDPHANARRRPKTENDMPQVPKPKPTPPPSGSKVALALAAIKTDGMRAPLDYDPFRCSLIELDNTRCRWPIGMPDAADFCFCGFPPLAGLPYCADHCRLAYHPNPERSHR